MRARGKATNQGFATSQFLSYISASIRGSGRETPSLLVGTLLFVGTLASNASSSSGKVSRLTFLPFTSLICETSKLLPARSILFNCLENACAYRLVGHLMKLLGGAPRKPHSKLPVTHSQCLLSSPQNLLRQDAPAFASAVRDFKSIPANAACLPTPRTCLASRKP